MKLLAGSKKAHGLRLAIVASRFNEYIVNRLIDAALSEIAEAGGDTQETVVARVPGAFEIPLAAKKLAMTKKYDAIICLGAVIRGETTHFDHLCSSVSKGITDVSLETNIPISFGVITAETAEQAAARSGKEQNKGIEAVRAAIEMATLFRELSS